MTVYKIPCGSRLRGVNKTSELSSLAGCKCEHLFHGCGSAIYEECGANGDLDLSICAIVHNVHRLCCRLALCLSFGAGMCTIGKLSRRSATTGCEDHDCANGGDSWFHVDVITNANGEIKL